MPSRIIDAEYLHYRNPSRNSDKVFNIFLVEEDDGSHGCISEHGRRGKSLVRVVVCSNKSLPIAQQAFRQKLEAKRNHRETPYWNSPEGAYQSPFARECEAAQNSANRTSQPIVAAALEKEKPAADRRSKMNGILNQGQIDSLEI
ncbi:MAG: hypothetical protein KIT61_17125 [Pyrinomonadaceae bacterium]|nr:hypothetical protein [Pyrinomonadaceae bacterium]